MMKAITCEYCSRGWLEYKGACTPDVEMCLCTCPVCGKQTWVTYEELFVMKYNMGDVR
jgi:hypothetical protein